MKVLKYSRQREAIKNFLSSRIDHPSADTVYESVRKAYPTISLGTVYRNLNLLVEMGEAIRITSKDGSDRFDARTSPHYHFICTKCNSVQDLSFEPIPNIEELVPNTINATIKNHEINFLGLCNNCSTML